MRRGVLILVWLLMALGVSAQVNEVDFHYQIDASGSQEEYIKY